MDDSESAQTSIEDVRHDIVLELVKESRKAANELARWTIASLLLANGGAVVALLRSDPTRAVLFEGAGWAFIAGFVAALLAGLFNSFFAELYANALEDELWSGKAAAKSTVKEMREAATGHGLGVGAISFLLMLFALGAFVWGCWEIAEAPKTAVSGAPAVDGADRGLVADKRGEGGNGI
ncbi:MAG TPA: hypothetical protein VF574_10385 [Allosphingosinicella sp.]